MSVDNVQVLVQPAAIEMCSGAQPDQESDPILPLVSLSQEVDSQVETRCSQESGESHLLHMSATRTDHAANTEHNAIFYASINHIECPICCEFTTNGNPPYDLGTRSSFIITKLKRRFQWHKL